MMEVYARIGGKWGQVGQELRRSGLGCRNRHRLLERNRTKSLRAIQPPQPVFEEPQYLHEEIPQPDIRPVYCPPEAYPSALGSEPSHGENTFRAPTPQMPSAPVVPPFQFSSSSLSAALSDPPRASLPLPPIPDEESNQCEPQLALSRAQDAALLNTVSPADLFITRPSTLTKSVPRSFSCHISAAQESPSPAVSSGLQSQWKSTVISSPETPPLSPDWQPPERNFDHSAMTVFSDPSSSSSSPFAPPGSLSPADSPDPCPSVELPPADFLPAESLLFAPAISHYRAASSRSPAKRKLPKTVGETRLSCSLPLSSDPNLRAYACGHSSCWPEGAAEGRCCFATSKELIEHRRTVHGEGESSVSARPYRCALASCGKSWKTLNGLQYHLQISTTHFRNAVSSTFESTEDGDNPSESNQDGDATEKDSRTYRCSHPQCFKAYKQPSGLRYHLKHGHPPELPAQLATVPPTLAREIPMKTRKMRRKDSAGDV